MQPNWNKAFVSSELETEFSKKDVITLKKRSFFICYYPFHEWKLRLQQRLAMRCTSLVARFASCQIHLASDSLKVR